MCGLEIMILPQHEFHLLLRIRYLKHVLAHETGQRIHLLHRDGLLKEVHCLHLPDTKDLAEFMTILRIIIVRLDEGILLELLAE